MGNESDRSLGSSICFVVSFPKKKGDCQVVIETSFILQSCKMNKRQVHNIPSFSNHRFRFNLTIYKEKVAPFSTDINAAHGPGFFFTVLLSSFPGPAAFFFLVAMACLI
jgi:hypothetical protein